MIAIRALDGTEVVVNENAVTLVAGPYPHDLGPHTYVHGVDRGVLVTAEDTAAVIARPGVDPPFGKVERTDASPVWIKRSVVSELRPPLTTEQQAAGTARSVVVIGDLHQTVREDVQTAMSVLNPPAANA